MNDLINHLKGLRITHIYCGAGARNAYLLDYLKDFKILFHFDERVAAFMALGHAKATGAPAVVCTTSGTAVAECLPACIEAYYSDAPLIILSADRPKRLWETYAPQTINQNEIFTPYLRSHFSGTIEAYKQSNISFPFQINLEIDDRALNYKASVATSFKEDFESSPVVLAIFTESSKNYEKELSQLENVGAMLYIECTSSLYYKESRLRVNDESLILKLLKNQTIQTVIKFGRTPITKIWRELDRNLFAVKVYSYQNEKYGLEFASFLENLPKDLTPTKPWNYPEQELDQLISQYPLSDIAQYQTIANQVEQGDIVYVGNSMAIRYWQLLNNRISVYANRGANGIDGQIATAIGIANTTNKIVHCIVGDLTFLYDLNSLVFKLPENVRIHVVDNGGGRIFERVNINKKMVLAHQLDLKFLIQGFIDSAKVEVYKACSEQTNEFWSCYGQT